MLQKSCYKVILVEEMTKALDSSLQEALLNSPVSQNKLVLSLHL